MSPLRVALFVEGSFAPLGHRGVDPLIGIWNHCLADALGIQAFHPVVPISKKHVVSMDPDFPPMSGAGEPLDQLVARTIERTPFDAAVVAWDLVPAWNPHDAFCRWQETADFYRHLAASTVLPKTWRNSADKRHQALVQRTAPRTVLRTRRSARKLSKHMILALCMEPMFEGLLVQEESAVKRALGSAGKQVTGWPTSGWGDPGQRHPDRLLLGPAVTAIRRLRPPPAFLRKIRGDMRTNKNGWGLHLIRSFLADSRARETLLGHPICCRLKEWVP